jgi:hypothetical protein
MHLHSLAGPLIALLSSLVSVPSCGDAQATAPTAIAMDMGDMPDQSNRPPRKPDAVAEDVLPTTADSLARRYAVAKVCDNLGCADTYRFTVKDTRAGVVTTVATKVSADTFLIVRTLQAGLGDTLTREITVDVVRRGRESADRVQIFRYPGAVDANPPTPGPIDEDTVVVQPPPVEPPPAPTTGFDGVAELPRVYVNTFMPDVTGPVIRVAQGENLQAAINGAARGSIIELAPGAVFEGNFILPAKAGTGVIILRTANVATPLGTRVYGPGAGYAKLVTRTVEPALRTASNAAASHYRIVGVEITSTNYMTYAIVNFGSDSARTVEELPSNLILDRVYVHMNETGETQRCVALNVRASAIIDSDLRRCRHKGSDSQGVIVWNGTNIAILNNRIEGAGENIMFGGATPRIQGLVPSDIEIRRNHLIKPPEWQSPDVWSVKNLFELKNSQRILIEANEMENNWKDSQTGFAVVLKSSNDDGRCSWCVTQDVTFRYNRIVNSPGGINIKDLDQYNGPGGIPLRRLSIHNIEMVNVGFKAPQAQPDATYRILQLLGVVTSVHMSHITALDSSNQILMFDDGSNYRTTTDTRLVNSVFGKTTYGIFGSSRGEGNYAINTYAQGSVITGNAFVRVVCANYPAGNSCPSTVPTVPGVNKAELERRLAGVK